MARFSVWTPEFHEFSGGIRVMWGLFGWLLIKGQCVLTNAQWRGKFTAIYPEIAHGNPLGGSRVIYYILNKPQIMASGGVPGPSKEEIQETADDIYVFSKIYDVYGVDENHLLFLPILDLFTFRDYGDKRPNTCYFVGKGRDIGKHPPNAIPIHHHIQRTQKEIADTLNTCHTMYTYENPTAMNEVARLCGCHVVYFEEGSRIKYTRDELERLYEPGMMGIGWGEKDESDLRLFREHYKNLITIFESKLDLFIHANHQDI